MEKFNWYKAVGFGALIWAVIFAFVSALAGYELSDSTISKIAVVIAAGLLSYLCIKNARPTTFSKAIGYGASWVLTGIVLDLIVSAQFNSYLFGAWEYWLSYALMLIVPMFSPDIQEIRSEVKTAHPL